MDPKEKKNWSLVQWTFLGPSLITSIIAFYFLIEQPPVHNGGLELCVLLGVSFLSLFVSRSEFDSFEKSCRDIDSECKDELECECTKKYNSIQKTFKRDTLC